ncbi:UNVERIFIED_CONTAM: putative mitochondrial protein [Sesamum latifolium]|uniref:Mitochondrial protein n=1 Tax=Sesamum latifolium TaxID=2727402 RepID=A0AAW2XYR8_9LAMI
MSIGGLGFRKLREFNWALLAKQEWRILTRPISLLSRVLKAKYFPTSSFEITEMGSHPLLTWRGICGAKWLLEKGCWQDSEGVWKWCFERTGRFSVKSAYRHAVTMRDREALPTMELLARQAVGVDKNCAMCRVGVESIRHVCTTGMGAFQHSVEEHVFMDRGAGGLGFKVIPQLDKEERGCYFTLCWALWRHRCKRAILEGVFRSLGMYGVMLW